MKAIVYTSNTGSTAQYAKLLAHEVKLPVYSLEEARKRIPDDSEIIYLGWIMASGIKGYEQAKKRYKIDAICAVGMGQTGTQMNEVRKKNAISDSTPLFTLQGNFDIKKLHGAYKVMMSIMLKTAGKALTRKTNRNSEEDDLLKMMFHGGERVKSENLKEIVTWYHDQKQGDK